MQTQAEAQDLIAQLKEGADFQALAKEHSTGPSGPNGGDLGWFAPEQMVKPFADAVIALEDGAFSPDPVQTQFGWHVILREESRDAIITPVPLDSAVCRECRSGRFLEKLSMQQRGQREQS